MTSANHATFKHAVRRLVAVAGVITLAGCTASSEQDRFADWALRDQPTWQQHESGLTHRLGELPTTQPAAADAIPADARVDDFVRMAVARNPELQAAQYRVERLAERVPQATSLDDPMLMVTPVGEMAQTAAGQVGLMTGISQKLPLPQKLNARGRIVQEDVALAESELEQTRLRIIADTRQSYWSYYYALRALEATGQSRALLASFTQITQSKLRTGSAAQADVLRSTTELSSLDNELISLAQQRDTAAARLNSLIDRPVTAPLPELPPTKPRAVAVRVDQLLVAAGASNPQLRGVLAQIEQNRQRLRLARLNYWPDLSVNANYNFVDSDGLAMAANGDDQYYLGFSINLPIWRSRLRAAEREAFRGIQENISHLTATQNRLAFEVREACAAVETQQRLVELFGNVIVPQAQQTVDASTAGYQSGSLGFLDYIDAWRKLLDYRLMHQRSIAQLEQQLAMLERLVGRPLAITEDSVLPASLSKTEPSQ